MQADDRLALIIRSTILTERNRILSELEALHESGKLTLRRIIQVVEDKEKDVSK